MTTTDAIKCTSFPRFSHLPFELRSQIWNDSLDETDGPALFFYRTGCWQPFEEPAFVEAEDIGEAMYMHLRHDLLTPVEIKMPLVFVNQEARDIALAWVRRQGVEIRFHEQRKCHVFVRHFDTSRDTLYIPKDNWREFCGLEPDNRSWQADLVNQDISTCSHVFRLALPEELFQTEIETIDLPHLWLFSIDVLFIIINVPPDMAREDVNVVVQERWEFGNKQGTWKYSRARDGSEQPDAEYIGDESLYKRLEEVNPELPERIPKFQQYGVEMRLASAVRI
jgi:hypothetical protein